MSKEAMKLALEALEKMARLTGPQWSLENNYVGHLEALTALREALAEQPAQQEPVAWMQDSIELYVQDRPGASYTIPLYTTPQAQEEPATLPEGKKLILVDGSFDDLMYWLERCEEKGHLENCPDLVEPLQNFSYKAYTAPQAQPRREWVGLTDEERDRIWSSYRVSFVAIGHIESKLREKNT